MLTDQQLHSVHSECHKGDQPGNLTSEFSPAETEFAVAMDRYKRACGRPFPHWSEVLGIVLALGYRRLGPPPAPAERPDRAARARARGVKVIGRRTPACA